MPEDNIEDLTKAQDLLTQASEDLAVKDTEIANITQKHSDLETALADKEVAFKKVTDELAAFKKLAQDKALSTHVDLMKKAGELKDDASAADIESLMEDLRELSEKALTREAALLNKMIGTSEDADDTNLAEENKIEKKQARKTATVAQLSEDDKEKRFNAFAREIGAEDLIREE